MCIQGWLQYVARVVRSWRESAACSYHSGVKWCDERNEDGSYCPHGASVDAVCQLCALSTACWRQPGQCAAFLPARSGPSDADVTHSTWICTIGLAFFQPLYVFRRSSVVAELLSGSGIAALSGFWQGFINQHGVAWMARRRC